MILVLLFYSIFAELTHAINFYDCCNQSFVKEKLACLNISITTTNTWDKEYIGVATFISPEIFSYSAGSLLLNMIYLEHHRFPIKVLSHDTGDDYHPLDKRWNKIKSISNALTTWALNCSYLVFIDADLIILNNDFDLHSIIDSNIKAHVIMSNDTLDSANTGFMIVRNTQWSIGFFDRWWEMKDTANTFCDQHVLNQLFDIMKLNYECDVDNLNNEISSDSSVSMGASDDKTCQSEFDKYIAILPHKTLNSQWPAIENFEPSDNILHLMGETHATRNAVIQYAENVACNVILEARATDDFSADFVFPHQFGLTKTILKELTSSALLNDIDNKIAICAVDTASNTDFESLHTSVSHYCVSVTTSSTGDNGSSNNTQLANFQCLKALHDAYEANQHHVDSMSTHRKQHSERRYTTQQLFHLDQMSMLLYDTLKYSPSHDKEAIGNKVLTLLDTISTSIDMTVASNRIYIHHKRGIIFGSLSEHLQSEGQWSHSLEREKIAITEYGTALQIATSVGSDVNNGANNGVIEMLKSDVNTIILDYIYSAYRLSLAFQHLNDVTSALEWSRIAINNADILFVDYSADQRLIDEERRRLYTHHIGICRTLHMYDEVKKYKEEVKKYRS